MHDELGSGQVDYTLGRSIIHFGSPSGSSYESQANAATSGRGGAQRGRRLASSRLSTWLRIAGVGGLAVIAGWALVAYGWIGVYLGNL